MEPLGAISELHWSFTDESEVTMAKLLGAYPDIKEQDQEASLGLNPMFWSDEGASSYNFFDNLSNTASTSSFIFLPSELENYELGDPDALSTNSKDYCAMEEQMTGSEYQAEELISMKLKNNVTNTTEEAIALSDHTSKAKRKFLEPENGVPTERMKKRKAQASVQVQKSVKNVRSKKAQKNSGTGDEALSHASCSSANESNTSQELNEGASTSTKGKTREGRGAATDPQSLYARKRRERINERLRILQTLVPNGTKVDISTMLEEAVQYVKFLQLQIKLLSSDALWMYAPLSYNGMDIGLDLKIPLPQQ